MNAGPDPKLRGRSAEIDQVEAALERSANGEQRIVLIDGEAGIGKSRLLTEAATRAAMRGFHVAAATGDEMELSRPFGLIADALGCNRTADDPRRAEIASLLAGRDRASGPVTVTSDPGLRFRVVDAICDLVVDLARDRPVCIALDDLQWADSATLLSMTNLCHATEGLPIALLAGHRPLGRTSPLSRTVAALDDAGAGHLSLRPLDDDAVHAVVADLLQREPDPGLLAAVSGATGNPLFVIELIQSIIGEYELAHGAEVSTVSAETLPDSVRLTILRRLS
ncbi:MAG TPA: AAA family ATPase, partial [Acidimicrobiales bacterium]|nr:AAA family ATPase [Acidimicrobiales bacterium]